MVQPITAAIGVITTANDIAKDGKLTTGEGIKTYYIGKGIYNAGANVFESVSESNANNNNIMRVVFHSVSSGISPFLSVTHHYWFIDNNGNVMFEISYNLK